MPFFGSFFDAIRPQIPGLADRTRLDQPKPPGREPFRDPLDPDKPIPERPIMDDDTITDPEDLTGEAFQLDIPDWLRRVSEEGFGQGFLRSSQQLGGTPLSERTNVAARGLREQSFLQGVSGSGFAGDKIRQLNLDRDKALNQLQLGIASQNEATQRQALSQLKDIELFNEQVTQDFENLSETEKLNQLMRQFQLESATRQFESQFQSTGTQLGSLGITAGLGLMGVPGMQIPGGITAGLGGLFSLFG